MENDVDPKPADDRESFWESIRRRWREVDAPIRWIVYCAVIGYVPIFSAGVVGDLFGIHGDEVAGFVLGWGLWITIPSTLIAAGLIFYELVRFLVGMTTREKY
jgi:hypothetical protein